MEGKEVNDSEILAIANRISGRYGLKADFLGDTRSVGVGGDARTYTRVIVLEGLFPGHEALAEISTAISNQTGVNRVTFEIARRSAE